MNLKRTNIILFKILLVVQNFKRVLKKLFEPSAFRDAFISGVFTSNGKSHSEHVFYVIHLNVRQSRQINDSAGIVKRVKKDFAIAKC